MSKLHYTALFIAANLITGCQMQSTPTTGSNHSCDSRNVQHLRGAIASPALLEKARKQAGARSARLLRPDDVVTLEHDPDRLNIYADDNLKIERLTCG